MDNVKVDIPSAYDNAGLDLSSEHHHQAVNKQTGRSTDIVVPFDPDDVSTESVKETELKKSAKIFVKGFSLPSFIPVESDNYNIQKVKEQPMSCHQHTLPISSETKGFFTTQHKMQTKILPETNCKSKIDLYQEHNELIDHKGVYIPSVHCYSPLVHSNTVGNIDLKLQHKEAPEYSTITTVNPCYSPSNQYHVPSPIVSTCDSNHPLSRIQSFLQPGEMRPRAWTFGNDRPQKTWTNVKQDLAKSSTPICLALQPSEKATVRRSCSLQSVRSGSTLSGYDDKTCRICWLDESAGELIQPCFCAGSSAFVHQQCLQHWLNVSNAHSCEICQYQFKTIRKMKPVSEWRWRPGKSRQLAQLEATMILLAIVTPPLLCGIILCSQKIADYFSQPGHAWKMAGLMTLVFISVSTYAGAVFYFGRKFAIVCKSWVNSNRTMTVTLTSDPGTNPTAGRTNKVTSSTENPVPTAPNTNTEVIQPTVPLPNTLINGSESAHPRDTLRVNGDDVEQGIPETNMDIWTVS